MSKIINLWLVFMIISHISLTLASKPELAKLRDPFLPVIDERQSLAPASPIMSTVIRIHYAHATDLVKDIKQKTTLLSKSGHVIADKRSNQLWLRDDAAHIRRVKSLVKALDVPIRQILIKASIIQIDHNYTRSLGLTFNTQNKQQNEGRMQMDLSSLSSSADTASVPIIKLADASLLNLQISALEQQGHANIIASPEIMTANRQAADIESGSEVPYQEKTGEGNTSTTFKKAVLRLKVSPEILPQQKILMKLRLNQDQVGSLRVNGVPAIQTQQLTTQVLLNNRETVVLGGIYEDIQSEQEEGIPLLRKIPGIGVLFRRRRHLHERRELLILVTPQIIDQNRGR